MTFSGCSSSDSEPTSDSDSGSETETETDSDPTSETAVEVEAAEVEPSETAEEVESVEVEAVEVEAVQLRIGLPFGVVQLAALGGAQDAAELNGIASTTTETITNPDALRTGFANGELDAAIMPTNIAANLFNRGVDVRVAGIVDAQLLHVLGPTGTTWSDLEGQTVYLPFQGDIADLIFRALLEANDVSVENLNLQYGTALPDLVGAAASGSASYLVLPEHFATLASAQATASGLDLVPAIDLQQDWIEHSGGTRIPQIALVVSGKLADSRPDVVSALSALAASNILTTTDSPDSAASLSEATGLPEMAVSMVLERLQLDYRNTSEARTDLDLFFETIFALSPDSLGGSIPGPDFFVE